MKTRTIEQAQRHGLLERLQNFESDLLGIDGVSSIDFDLSGFEDHIYQVIILAGYDIPVTLPNYYDVRHRMLCMIIMTALDYGLQQSGDGIEDYGAHFYIVRNCDETWKTK